MKRSVPCELCGGNIVVGIVHRINNLFVCDECKTALMQSEGVEFDGHHQKWPRQDALPTDVGATDTP